MLTFTRRAVALWAVITLQSFVATAQPIKPPKPLVSAVQLARTCQSLASISIPNTTIDLAAEEPAKSGTNLPYCRVVATVTHPPAGDRIKVFLALPITGWNGRFVGIGGGGFVGGTEESLRAPVALGYAAGSTDTGHQGGGGDFALDANGRLNWTLIRDNAHAGIHEMTVLGKALTEAFYNTAPRRSYFAGCSSGGRQGLSEAQRYPADYDGIIAGAPAVSWTKLHVSQMWGQVLMLEANHFIPQCKFEAAVKAAVEACDALDGVKDGVITDPRICKYDPQDLIGKPASGCEPINQTDADIIRKIWEGPRRQDGSVLWYGLTRGASFSGLYNTGDPRTGKPFPITLAWFRYFLTQNPNWDWTTITRGAYEQFWTQSTEQFGEVFATGNPDLTAFRDHGGKAILWHGWNDQLIYPQGTIDYFDRVQQKMGQKTTEFIRLFMAPGANHCASGAGPVPSVGELYDSILAWVEDGKAPSTLTVMRMDGNNAVKSSRPLCVHPLVARYKGSGSIDDKANFVCAAR